MTDTEAASPPVRCGPSAIIAFAVISLAVTGTLHFLFAPIPSDADTAYHAAVGKLIREHGLLRAFPWTPMSWLADHYADKELLFHLLFASLSGLGWVTASNIVGTLAGAALLMTIYLVLRAEGVRLAGLWAVLPLVASSVFLYRFLLVRPHLLSIALVIIFTWAAARGRLLLAAVSAFVYPWTYIAWVLPFLLAGIVETARIASGKRLRWKPVVVAVAAMVVGVAIHPNAANLLRFTWLVLGGVLVENAWGSRPGLQMGAEFAPFPPAMWVELLLLAATMAVIALGVAWKKRRTCSIPLAFGLAALVFGAATVLTARFAEYFVPLSVVALALSLRHVDRPGVRLAPAVLLALALIYQGREEVDLLARLRVWPNRIPSYVAKVMREAIPPGARVFTCEWGMTGYLMLALPERQFLVALDPSLFQAKDPELYRLWYLITRQPPANVAELVRERFGARYVACFYDEQFQPFNERLAVSPGVRTLLISDDWNVYDLGAPSR